MTDPPKPSSKRKKSLTPEIAPVKRQTTLLSAFAKIDQAAAAAAVSSQGSKPKPSVSVVDLSKPTATFSAGGPASSVPGSQPQRSSGSQPQPQRSVSHVSASYVEFGNQSKVATSSLAPMPSVSHVSDSYKPRSVQASAAAHSGLQAAGPSVADEASSPQLSSEQEEVMRMVRDGSSIFFTGNAGTGKTFMLNCIIEELKRKHGKLFASKVALAAPTGIAATHIQGTTLNSALGIGACNFYKDWQTMMKKETRARVRAWEVLIIDEVSMLSAEFFQQMENKLREIRGVGKPSGGLQLIMCGDFFQLPPVSKRWVPGTPLDAFLNWGYAFQSPAWKTAGIEHVLLTKVFRQQDGEFVRILDDIRYGRNAQKALLRLRELCMRPLPSANGIKPTQLYSRNKEVDETNDRELARLAGEVLTFVSSDEVQVDPTLRPDVGGSNVDRGAYQEAEARLQRNEFFRDCLAQRELRLKIGAQVMLLKNLDLEGGPNNTKQLVNGSRGVVIGTMPKADCIKKLELERKALGGDDRSKVGLMDSRTSQKVGALQRQIEALKNWSGKEVPVVRFRNGAEMEILPCLFSSTVQNTGECKRLQVPLKLAWALTIHKCQGLTLDLVQVSLRDCFAQGQAYVALSRARSLDGLQILDFDANCVKTDPAVGAFYIALRDGDVGSLKEDAWDRWMAMRKGDDQQQQQPMMGGGGATAAIGKGSSGAMAGGVRPTPASSVTQKATSFGGAGSAYGGGGGRDRSGDKCYHCQGTGHWASNCPSKRPGGGVTAAFGGRPTQRG